MSFDSVTAFIGLGSNLGDRISWLLAGRAALAEMAETEIVGASRLYETAPVGPADQGPYLNSVLALQTGLPARELLNQMLDVEKDQGRVRTRDAERWGPRTLDLDLLLVVENVVQGNVGVFDAALVDDDLVDLGRLSALPVVVPAPDEHLALAVDSH